VTIILNSNKEAMAIMAIIPSSSILPCNSIKYIKTKGHLQCLNSKGQGKEDQVSKSMAHLAKTTFSGATTTIIGNIHFI
jgi:hypothetical protein